MDGRAESEENDRGWARLHADVFGVIPPTPLIVVLATDFGPASPPRAAPDAAVSDGTDAALGGA